MSRDTSHLLIYDISRNKLRTKVAKIAEGYGVRVQKSAFECRLTRGMKARVWKSLENIEPGPLPRPTTSVFPEPTSQALPEEPPAIGSGLGRLSFVVPPPAAETPIRVQQVTTESTGDTEVFAEGCVMAHRHKHLQTVGPVGFEPTTKGLRAR